MKTFSAFFAFEFKRLLKAGNIVLFLLFFIASMFFVQSGITNYKSTVENQEYFQNIEKQKIGQYFNWAVYGAYGFRLMFVPSPLSIFFDNSATISGLTANVDNSDVLRIYNSYKGKELFSEKSGGFKDFSGLFLLFGSILILYFGYDALRHRDYSKFLSGFFEYRKVFFSTTLARVLLYNLFLAVTLGCALLWMSINKIRLQPGEFSFFLAYCLTIFLLLLFFFTLGTLAGSIKSKFTGLALIFIIWFIFIFFIPGTINSITSQKADTITSNYNLELEKMRLLMAFERRAIDEEGVLQYKDSPSDNDLALVESYWNNEAKQMRDLEQEMEGQIARNIKYFQKLSILFPSTFYMASSNEISSKGYESYIDFYRYIQKLQHDFGRFWLNKRYHSNTEKVESFIKGDENLYKAQNSLPKNFWGGILLTLVYILFFLIFSLFRFKSFLRDDYNN